MRICYSKKRRKIDIKYKILLNLRCGIWRVLNGHPKLSTTMKLIGCSIEKLKKHLESQFTKGMNWTNYGNGWYGRGMKEWHIDHIKPCAKFDLSKPSEQRKCFHYTNLQPLWAEENWRKAKK